MTSAEAAKVQVSSETRTNLLLLKATVAKQRKHTLFVASSELKQTSSTEYELVARYTILLPMQLDQPEFSLINLQIFRVLVKRTVGSDGLTQRSSQIEVSRQDRAMESTQGRMQWEKPVITQIVEVG